MLKHFAATVALTLCTLSCASAPPAPERAEITLQDFQLSSLPDWAKDGLEEGIYLDIDSLMKRAGFTRLEAVETQSQMREALFVDHALRPEAAFQRALGRVRSGQLDSGWKPVEFKRPGEFVVVVDGDETVFKHWFGSWEQGNYDLEGITPDEAVSGRGERVKSARHVRFTPGVEAFVARMRRNPLCRGVVLFSGKRNIPTHEIMARWKFSDGRSAAEHFDGIFGRSHMVLGRRIVVPGKDLRIIDPELKHVVLIDDNPAKVVQHQITRAQPKFDADRYLRAQQNGDREAITYYETLLSNAAEEIERVALDAEKRKVHFSQAFLPYSYSGERVFRTLSRTLGNTERARELTQLRPEMQDATFRPDRDMPVADAPKPAQASPSGN